MNNYNDLIPDKAEMNALKRFVKNILKTKNPDAMIEDAGENSLKKTLGAFDLIILGVGAIIGSGIFTVVGLATVGDANSLGAGPALVVSMLLASLACVFSAMCYSEFASMIPVAGSAYLYTYATLGEFMAWIIGWVLMLEYLVGYIAVANAWTGYLFQFLKGFEHVLPSFVTNESLWVMHYGGFTLNIPATIVTVMIAGILIKGIKESTKMAGLMVIIKMSVIAIFIIAGAFYIKPENWTPFAPNGFEGIFAGAFMIFFAYIGFDAIATAAEETKNPQKNLPIGIIGSLMVCTVVYILVGLVLTGVMPLNLIDIHAPIAHAMRYVGQDWVAGFISLGALTGLTSVLMVLMLAATRVLFAMSRDRFLPKSLQVVHKKFKTPHFVTIIVALICIVGSVFLSLKVAAELCNFGTFASFIIVCVAVLILRKTDPKRERPFKVPFVPLFPILGILSCGGLMVYYMMKFASASLILFPIWIFMGILIYFSYSYKQHRRAEKDE